MYLPLDQSGKLLTRTHRKPLKMVRVVDIYVNICVLFSSFNTYSSLVCLAAPNVAHLTGPFQSSTASLEPEYIYGPDSSSVLGNPVTSATLSSWNYGSVPPVNVTQVTKGFS